MNKLKTWMAVATSAEKKRLAELAGTTVGTLRQATGGYKSHGELRMTAEFAQRIAAATIKIKRLGLPSLAQEDLCPACAGCEYMRRCVKD